MTDQKFRAGVIGCGLGANHAYAYANAHEYDLIAVCDLSAEVLGNFYENSRLEPGSV